jgi:hypothetical protein
MSKQTIAPKDKSYGASYLGQGDPLALLAKYALPVGETIAGAANARKKFDRIPTRFSRVRLSAAPIIDMQRPSFATPVRHTMGSSLAEHIGGQKFADAFQTAQGAQFDMQNQLSKIQQMQQNVGTANQQAMTNAEIDARETAMNAELGYRDYAYEKSRRDAGLNEIYRGLASDPTQIMANKSGSDLRKAAFFVQNPDSLPPNEKEKALNWAHTVLGFGSYGGLVTDPLGIQPKEENRMGGKLKRNKFTR